MQKMIIIVGAMTLKAAKAGDALAAFVLYEGFRPLPNQQNPFSPE
jgi:hypothetical protein